MPKETIYINLQSLFSVKSNTNNISSICLINLSFVEFAQRVIKVCMLTSVTINLNLTVLW